MFGNFLFYRNITPALRRVLLEKYRSWQLQGTNLSSTAGNVGKVPVKQESSVIHNELTEATTCKLPNQRAIVLPEDTTQGLQPKPLNESTKGTPQDCANNAPEGLTGGAFQGQPPEPPEPGICCMTGCANCVWIKHVEELKDFYQDKGKEAARKALEQIPDENLKAFLKIELDLNN